MAGSPKERTDAPPTNGGTHWAERTSVPFVAADGVGAGELGADGAAEAGVLSAAEAPGAEMTWEALTAVAVEACTLAYAPYSHYPVGAAALVSDGRVIKGCNIENASYGLTLCAECSLLGDLMAGGGGRLRAFVCVNGAGQVIMPCGRCRQLLWEHGGSKLVVLTPEGPLGMAAVLPQAFGPDDLEELAQLTEVTDVVGEQEQ